MNKICVRDPESAYGDYFLPQRTSFNHVHNIFVQSYLEQGYLGLVGIVGLVLAALVIGGRALAREPDRGARSTLISASGVALALILTGLTDVVAVTTIGMVVLFGALALLDAAGRSTSGHHGYGHRMLKKFASTVAAVMVLLPTILLLLNSYIHLAPWGASLPARRLMQTLLAVAPADVSLNLGALGVAHATLARLPPDQHKQRMDVARFYLHQALARDPQDPDVYRQLAMAALAVPDRVQARLLLSEAEALAAPDDSRFLFQLGRLYRDASDVNRAVSVWSRADPEIGVWNGAGSDSQLIAWGARLIREARWGEAVLVNGAAIRMAPAYQGAYRALAIATIQVGGPAAALASMEGFVQRYPDVPWPYLEAAELADQLGRVEDARIWRERVAPVWTSEGWMARQREALANGIYLVRPVR